MLLAKCAVPVIVSAAMLLLSSLLTLAAAAIVGQIAPNTVGPKGYSAEQLVLLFPVGLSSALAMTLLSAMFAVALRTPRQGLYASSAISFLFVFPVLAIMYLLPDPLLWSQLYAVALVSLALGCVRAVSGRASRPQIMSRL
jgi:hypothetical protein